jgi:hypothetical protein
MHHGGLVSVRAPNALNTRRRELVGLTGVARATPQSHRIIQPAKRIL